MFKIGAVLTVCPLLDQEAPSKRSGSGRRSLYFHFQVCVQKDEAETHQWRPLVVGASPPNTREAHASLLTRPVHVEDSGLLAAPLLQPSRTRVRLLKVNAEAEIIQLPVSLRGLFPIHYPIYDYNTMEDSGVLPLRTGESGVLKTSVSLCPSGRCCRQAAVSY